MKRTKLSAALAALCAAALAGCANSQSSSGSDSTPEQTSAQTTVTTADEQQVTEPPETTTSAEETTTAAADTSADDTTTTASSETEPDAEPEKVLSIVNNKVICKAPRVEVAYPENWSIKDIQPDNADEESDSIITDLASLTNEELGVSAMIQQMKFEDQETVNDYISTLRETYENVAEEAGDDPMAPMNFEFEESKGEYVGSLLTSYTQRGVKSYVYTFVCKDTESKNVFLVFSYSYSDSENADNIRVAIQKMMPGEGANADS